MASDKQELRTDEWKSDREIVGTRCVLGEGVPVAVYVEVSLLYGLLLSSHPSTVLKPQGELDQKNSLLMFLKQLLLLLLIIPIYLC